jgi:hypothetical protein
LEKTSTSFSDQLEEEVQPLPLLLINQLLNKLPNQLKSLLLNPNNNQSQLRRKRWIWEDCLIEEQKYLDEM